MTIPGLVFSFFVATMLGSFLHLWRGGSLGRLVLYLVLSWVGFMIGHMFAELQGIDFLDVGTIHLGMGIFGSLLFLGIGYWLSLMNLQDK